MIASTGTLWLVATPIGNLDDFSPRAQAVLTEVDWIAAEDTRHSRILLNHANIQTRLFALHAHNESGATAKVMALLQKGQSVALISDAGTPAISDPGAKLLQAAHASHYPVRVAPGPCAAIAAFAASGFCGPWVFQGFLPPKANSRQSLLHTLATRTEHQVFFEAPHRLLASLEAMRDAFGHDRPALLARELTKQHETLKRLNLGELYSWVKNDPYQQKGECVVVVEGNPDPEATAIGQALALWHDLKPLMSRRDAIALLAKHTGARKNTLQRILQ